MLGSQGKVILAALGQRQLGEQVPQIAVWLNRVRASRLNEAVQSRTRMSPARRSREQPIAATNHERPYGVPNEIGIRSQIGAVQIPKQLRPLRQRVGDRLAQKHRGGTCEAFASSHCRKSSRIGRTCFFRSWRNTAGESFCARKSRSMRQISAIRPKAS